MPKISIDRERCKGCNLCVDVCPRHLIRPTADFNKKGYCSVKIERMEECTACLRCALICPETAIEVWKDE